MDNIFKGIYAEREKIEKVLNNLKDVLDRKEKTHIELTATATYIQNIYNGIENILKQTLSIKNIAIPKSDSWHKDLLNISVSNGIISDMLSNKLYDYLTFRHFFIHSYGYVLEEVKIKELTDNVFTIWTKFIGELEIYISSYK